MTQQRSTTSDKVKRLKEKFRTLDASGDGKLDFPEMVALLQRGNPGLTERELKALYDVLDLNGDGKIDFDEFVEYLFEPPAGKVEEIFVPTSVPVDVGQVFLKYCTSGPKGDRLDCKGLNKLAKDCHLLGGRLTHSEVDVCFHKVKSKALRAISEREFLKCLTLFAEKRGMQLEDVYTMVGEGYGPVLKGTQADYVRFHDDKSTYTGVQAKGQGKKDVVAGPMTLEDCVKSERKELRELEKYNDLKDKELAGQLEADRLERLISGAGGSSPSSPAGGTKPMVLDRGREPALDDDTDWSLVEPTFNSYCSGGGHEMYCSEFLRVLKDCNLLDAKTFRLQDVDTVFKTVASRGERTISLSQFKDALRMIAERKKIAPYFVQTAVTERGHHLGKSGVKPPVLAPKVSRR